VSVFKHANDDYSAIMAQGAAGPPRRSAAERLHQRVRKDFWAYAATRRSASGELIGEKYSRHPPSARLSGAARPHRESDLVSSCSNGERNIGVRLTESFAMWPGSVCGLYFSHPESYYFGVGRSSAIRSRTSQTQGLDAGANGEMAWRRSSITIRWHWRATRRNNRELQRR